MKYSGRITLIVCEIVLGVLLFIDPLGFTGWVIKLAGAAMLILAVFSAIDYFRSDPVEACLEKGLAKALVLLAAGLFCILKTDWFIATFPIFTMIYGVAILLTGIARVEWSVDMVRMKSGRWYIPAIGAAISLILAAVILANPFTAAEVLWKFIAITLFIDAAADIAALIFAQTVEKEIERQIEK